MIEVSYNIGAVIGRIPSARCPNASADGESLLSAHYFRLLCAAHKKVAATCQFPLWVTVGRDAVRL